MTTTENIRLAAAILVSIVCATGIWYLWRPSKGSTAGDEEQLQALREAEKTTSALERRRSKAQSDKTTEAAVNEASLLAQDVLKADHEASLDDAELQPQAAPSLEAGLPTKKVSRAKRQSRRELRAAKRASSKQASGASDFAEGSVLSQDGIDKELTGQELTDQELMNTEVSNTAESSLANVSEPAAESTTPALLDGLFDLNRLQRENDELLGRDWFGGGEESASAGEGELDQQAPAERAAALPDTLGAMIGRAAISAASSASEEKVDPLQLLFAQSPLTEGAVSGPASDEPSVGASTIINASSEPSEGSVDDSWGSSAAEMPAVDETEAREEQKRIRRLEKAESRRVKAQRRRDRRAKHRDARQTEQRPPSKRALRRELRASARAVKNEAAALRRAEEAAQKQQLKADQQAMRANQRDAQKAAARKLGLDAASSPSSDAWTTAATNAVAQIPEVVQISTSATLPATAPVEPAPTTSITPLTAFDEEVADVWPAEASQSVQTASAQADDAPRLFGREGGLRANVLDQLFGDVESVQEQLNSLPESSGTNAPSQSDDPWAAAAVTVPDSWAASDQEASAPMQVAALGVAAHDAFGLPEPLPARNASGQ